MKNMLCLICLAVLIGGCSFNQRPAWIIVGERRLDSFKTNYLTDARDFSVESNFKKAVEEIKKSGGLDLLEKAWLTRMALQGAVLKEMDEGDYREIAAVEPVPENENFYKFLKGDISDVDIKLLPEQYRGFLSAVLEEDVLNAGREIASMKEEPVSRLVAAGIAVRRNLESEAIIQTAVETASVNGWKMALIVWLERLSAFYEAEGEADKAADVRRRVELIEK